MPTLEDLLTPVSGTNPAGEYLRYDPIYDKIKEARREDLDVPQGEWQTSLKSADWPLVIKLAGEALAKRSKDLQLAAWLTEAMLRRNGFSGLREGLELTVRLLEEFWDVLYPELEDGDAELRATPLVWIGQYLDVAVRQAPLNPAGHHLLDYQSARTLGYEQEVESDSARREARKAAVAQGKVVPEAFDRSLEETSKEWYRALVADLDASLATVEALDRIGEERFGDDAPSYLKLRQALQEVRQVAGQLLDRKLAADPDPVVAHPPARPAAPHPEAGAPAGGPAPAPDAPPARVLSGIAISATPGTGDDAAARIAACARFLRAQAPASPAPYLLLRGYRWGELRGAAPEVDPTLLEAPPVEARVQLKNLLLGERWRELLEAGEEVMATPFGRGWLDLQRYSIAACDALSSEYEPLGRALRSALRTLLEDLPRLAGAALMDDSPAANSDTVRWLRAEGLLPDEEAVPEEDAPRPGRRDAHDRARELLRAKKPEEAIDLLLREASREECARDRFLRRLQATRIMLDAGFEAVARPLLEDLVEEVDQHGLERWESGATVADLLTLMHRCVRKLDGEYADTQALLLRITRLDPVRAIRLGREAGNGGSGE